jgi:hypothetical protein
LIEDVRVEVTLEKETVATQEDPMNADVLTARVADGIVVIILGSTRRIYFDEEMGERICRSCVASRSFTTAFRAPIGFARS